MSEENSHEAERFTEVLQLRITPAQDREIKKAAAVTGMKQPELVRQALRCGVPALLRALGRDSSHGAELMPVPSTL